MLALDSQFRCQIRWRCLWFGQEVRASLNKTTALVTVTVLHIPILAFAHVEALNCGLLNLLYQFRKMSHVPLLSLKLKPSVTPGALVQKRKNRQRLLRVLYVMRWQLVVSSLLINDGNIHADDANTTFFSCITVDSFPTLHGGMLYQYDRNIFVLLDPDTVCPVHYTVYPTIFQSLYK